MAKEFDNNSLPDLLQATFDISLGAAVKGLELMRKPEESIGKVMSTVKDLMTIPDDESAPGLQAKAQSIAGVWMEKGATIISECKSAGEKFTEGK
jgi:hypothetical protein